MMEAASETRSIMLTASPEEDAVTAGGYLRKEAD